MNIIRNNYLQHWFLLFKRKECLYSPYLLLRLSYRLNALPPSTSNLYVVTLISNMMVFGGGAFGKSLSLDEAMRVDPP